MIDWTPDAGKRYSREDRIIELVNNLEIGDEVITSGGIVCTLVKLSDAYVTARTGNNQEIVLQRQQINSVLPKGTVKSLFE